MNSIILGLGNSEGMSNLELNTNYLFRTWFAALSKFLRTSLYLRIEKKDCQHANAQKRTRCQGPQGFCQH